MKFDVAGTVQRAFAAVIAEAPPTTFPARRYVWVGAVILEGACEEFIAHGVTVTQGLPGALGIAEQVRDWSVWSIQFGLTVVRCVPVDEDGQPLDPAEATAMGLTALEDAGALMRYTLAAEADGTLLPHCDAVVIGPVVWGGPFGGTVGTTLLVTAQLG